MNGPMPSRGNLVAECVRVMRLRIAAGEWNQLLPGERRLAGTLHVGRDTIRLAVLQLERESSCRTWTLTGTPLLGMQRGNSGGWATAGWWCFRRPSR